MKAKTCATEEEECDQTRDSALPLLDTGTGAEFQNPSYSLGHDICIFLDIFNRYYDNVCISFLTRWTYLFVNWRNRNAQECAMRLPESQRDNPICHGRKLSII